MANQRLFFLVCNIYGILAEYSLHSCTFRWALWHMGLWFIYFVNKHNVSFVIACPNVAHVARANRLVDSLPEPRRSKMFFCKNTIIRSTCVAVHLSHNTTKTRKVTVRPTSVHLIRVFGRKLGSLATHWAHSEDWSDWVDAQADLILRWTHSHFVGFVMSRLIWSESLLSKWSFKESSLPFERTAWLARTGTRRNLSVNVAHNE